jgi:hypothetical protein
VTRGRRIWDLIPYVGARNLSSRGGGHVHAAAWNASEERQEAFPVLSATPGDRLGRAWARPHLEKNYGLGENYCGLPPAAPEGSVNAAL